MFWQNAPCKFVLLAWIAPILSGCFWCHVYRPVDILVRDAETKQPIEQATVTLNYQTYMMDFFAPWPCSGTSSGDGKLSVLATPYGLDDISLTAQAEGYLFVSRSYPFTREQKLPLEQVRTISPTKFLCPWTRGNPDVIVEMYAKPAPTVELIVPPGYRGPIKVDFEIDENNSVHRSNRLYTAVVLPAGLAKVKGDALLRQLSSVDFRVRFADQNYSTLLEKNSPIELHFVDCSENSILFALGTRADKEKVARLVNKILPSGSMQRDPEAYKRLGNPEVEK
jgi:hypothetical protein